MGTITAQTIINRAARLLEDVGNVSFTRDELRDWLNEAQTQVVNYAPGSNSKVVSVPLAAGTRQTLPTESVLLLDITRNTGGTTVRLVTRESLDGGPSDWHTAKAEPTVRVYCYDTNTPDIFYVYPPNDGTGSVDIAYAEVPTVISSDSQTISVKDTYAAALLNYMLYRVYSRDTDYLAGGKEAAAAYFTAFQNALSGRATLDAVSGANAALAAMQPTNSGSTK